MVHQFMKHIYLALWCTDHRDVTVMSSSHSMYSSMVPDDQKVSESSPMRVGRSLTALLPRPKWGQACQRARSWRESGEILSEKHQIFPKT